MNEQTPPERIPLGELYRKSETEPEELDEQHTSTPQETRAEPAKPPEKLSRLEKLEQKKAQLENQIKAIHARENEKVRRERTRRLIQMGAIAVKYLNCPDDISPSDFEGRMKQVVEVPEVKAIIKRS